jgi:hypothetical protein
VRRGASQPSAFEAVLLSHAFWARRFAADPGVVGRPITLDGAPATVVGVLPASFDFGSVFAPGARVDYFAPFPLSPETDRQGNTLILIGHLRPGATLADAQRETAALVGAGMIDEPRPDGLNAFAPRVRGLREAVSGTYRPPLLVLAGAVGLVLLLVCANLANLLLTRVVAREPAHAVLGNVEGVGVAPDVAMPPARALEAAHVRALGALAAGGPAARRPAYRWALTAARAAADPVSLPPAALARYAGVYGERSVRLRGDTLVYQRQGGPEVPLTPMGDHTFSLAGTTELRLRFDVAGEPGDGPALAVRARYSDGTTAAFPRTR